jgi:uncharacterized protein (TIGR02145 family)
LVGISPLGDYWDSTVVVYVPSTNTSAATYSPSTAGANSWGTSISDVPYNNSAPTNTNPATDNLGTTFTSNKGDICKFITLTGKAPAGSWRIPTAAEFGTRDDWSTLATSDHPELNEAPNDAGTAHVHCYRQGTLDNWPKLLYAGYRNYTHVYGYSYNGYGTYTSHSCMCWTSTYNSSNNGAYYLYSNNSHRAGEMDVFMNTQYNALPVRCVKN